MVILVIQCIYAFQSGTLQPRYWSKKKNWCSKEGPMDLTRPGYKKYLYFLYEFNLRTKMVSIRTKNAKRGAQFIDDCWEEVDLSIESEGYQFLLQELFSTLLTSGPAILRGNLQPDKKVTDVYGETILGHRSETCPQTIKIAPQKTSKDQRGQYFLLSAHQLSMIGQNNRKADMNAHPHRIDTNRYIDHTAFHRH